MRQPVIAPVRRLKQRPGDGDRHEGDEREVDAAADHHQRHRDTQHPEYGNASDQIEQIAGRKEAGQSESETDTQHQGQTEYDLLLTKTSE
jgi:hypothetical protein